MRMSRIRLTPSIRQHARVVNGITYHRRSLVFSVENDFVAQA